MIEFVVLQAQGVYSECYVYFGAKGLLAKRPLHKYTVMYKISPGRNTVVPEAHGASPAVQGFSFSDPQTLPKPKETYRFRVPHRDFLM